MAPDFRRTAVHVTIAFMERRTIWLAAGFAAGLALIGIPFWRQPYNADYLADLMLQLGFVGLAAITAALAASGVASLKRIFWTMLAIFPAAIMIRVIVEVAQDPTDHNLWPFELLFAAAVSLLAVVPGLLVGWLCRRLTA